jgi:hypothetical protein
MADFNRVGNAWEFRAAGHRLRLTLHGLEPVEQMTEEDWLTAKDAAETIFDDDPGRHENLLRGLETLDRQLPAT